MPGTQKLFLHARSMILVTILWANIASQSSDFQSKGLEYQKGKKRQREGWAQEKFKLGILSISWKRKGGRKERGQKALVAQLVRALVL